MSRRFLCAAIVSLAGVVGGCMSSSQMSRIDRNRDIYETWPLEIRQAVLDGKAEPGMTPEMVRVALGEPSEITARSNDPGADEIWIYRTGGHDNSSMMGTYPGGYPGGVYPGGTYPGGVYPGGYPGGVGSSGGGIVIGGGRGTGTSVGVIPPSIGIGGGVGGISIGGGGMGGGYPMPVSRTPVDEREVVFRNGVVLRADPPPDKK